MFGLFLTAAIAILLIYLLHKLNKMTDLQNMKAKALSKDCIIILLDMISKHKVITSKTTNATNNKLKEEAWKSIAQEFSALTGDFRRAEQLRLKWENLKKAARKRSALIRQNNFKTGGGKAFIPPDEVLERVASILGATCTGLSVEFGGDGENYVAVGQVPSEAVVEVMDADFQLLPDVASSSNVVVLGGDDGLDAGGGNEKNYSPKKFIFNTPNKGLNKRRKLAEEVQRAQRDKDLKLAAYFQVKAEKAGLENKKIELENRKLELECKNLELENVKLELEIKQLKHNTNC